MKQTRLLLVDDHAIVRKGVKLFLDTEPTVQIVGEAKDGKNAVDKAFRLKPDVILMDLIMPENDGFEAIAELKEQLPQIKIIVLTTFNNEKMFESAMQAGADGYILKDADGEALLKAIQTVQAGGMAIHPDLMGYLVKTVRQPSDSKASYDLTEREIEILTLVGQGMSNRVIAETLSISEGTVKAHLNKIFGKLQVTSRTKAALQAVQLGLVSTNNE